MTIRHRITALVLLMFVALTAIGGYAVFQTRNSAVEVKQVTEGVVPSALASADLVGLLKDVQLAMMTLVYAPDANILSQAQDQLKAKEAALRDALAVQAKSAVGQAQTGLISQADDSLQNYFSAIDDTAKMKADGKNELAQAYLFANVAQYRDEMEGIVENLRIQKNRQKDDAISALNQSLSTTTATIGAVTGIAVIALALIGTLLYRQITRPLSSMQKMMSEIATNQDFTRRLPVGRMDEIGHSIVAFNGMIEKIQHSSTLIKQKTADIQAMLQNIQQGILTVIDGVVVHAEYSTYLEDIFETKDIAGRKLIDLVFSDTDIGADALSQIDAATHACLGEDAINFAFNQHLLAGEVNKRMPDGRVKILDLSWSAITDDDDIIVRLMLCVRDVTELRKLAAEADEQRRRLETIGEILAVNEEKFHHFVETSAQFIGANEHIIRKHDQADLDAIAELFRNMHTIKGNARTYNLRHLTNLVHETEQTYEALRRQDADREWNQMHLLEELSRVKDALEHYVEINEVSLGRKGRGPAVNSERYMLVDKAQIEHSLHLLETADTGTPHGLMAMREQLRRTLRLLGTESMGDALSGVLEALPSLARELDKAVPAVRIDDNGYRLQAQAVPVLQNVFMHLLRNAIDHGIESAAERIAAGKHAAGIIEIEAGIDHDTFQITLSDDGRGLALSRIRQIAVARGWITQDETVSDEEIAQFIFRPGFSTAEKVTEVSGRGVGMDAVRDFLKQEHGHIELRFTDDRTGEAFRHFQTVISLPDRFAVDSLGVVAPAPVEMMDTAEAPEAIHTAMTQSDPSPASRA